MADAIITLKIMPENPEVDLEAIKTGAKQLISEFGGEVGKENIEPVAFGLNAVILTYVADEKLGGTDELEEKIGNVAGVAGVEVTDVRRAIG
jgi:elongation factor 1-beta